MSGSLFLRKVSHVDPVLLGATFALIGLGLVMVFSAGSATGSDRHSESTYFLRRQMVSFGIGLAAMTFFFLLRVQVLRHMALPALFAVGALLLITSFSSVGVAAKSATRWIGIAGVTFQPSEFAKPILITYIAAYLAKRKDRITDLQRGLLPLLLTVGGVLLLILRQPDFGTVVLLAMVTAAMLFVGRAKTLHLAGLGGLAAAAGWFLIRSSAYRQRRFIAFLDPWADAQGSGFQIIQSLVAFGRGGIHGQGLGDGTQKLFYLPEAHTDFIYSVIAEELGLFGSLVVIVLFATLVFRGLRLARRVGEPFASYLAFGLTTLIGFQAIINMAVVMGLLPTKGITLPFISYGGSSLISMMASLGVLLSMSASVDVTRRMARRRST